MNSRAKTRHSSLLLTCTLGLALAGLSGCADPEGSFVAFTERFDAIEAAKPPKPPTACPDEYELLSPGQGDGQYLLVLSATQKPEEPITFLAEVTTPAIGSDVGLGFSVTPLDKTDRKTPLGPAQTFEPTKLDEFGKFTYALDLLAVPAKANTIAPIAVEANLTLTGNVCGDGSFVCGDVVGKTVKPSVDLEGSTFTIMKIEDPNKYPDPVLNCEEAPAKPLE